MTKKKKIDVSKTLFKIDSGIAVLKETRKRIKEIGDGKYFTLEELKQYWKEDEYKLNS